MVTKKPEKKTSERAKEENIEKIVVDLGNKGLTPAKIGQELKEKYGIQKIKLLGKKITKILEENNIIYEDDIKLVDKRIKKIEGHYNKNKQDKRAGRELVRFISLKKKLEKYKNK